MGEGTFQSAQLDAVDAIRAFFVTATCTTLTISLVGPLRSRFITYGPRATPASKTDPRRAKPEPSQPWSTVSGALDSLASLKVPHSYFIQFYITSVLFSAFWAIQLLSRGPMFQAIAKEVRPEHLERSMSVSQVVTCWALMTAQGVRRLYESFVFSKPSSSKMWFFHWLLGIAFYSAAGIAIWIEGTGALLANGITLKAMKVTAAPSLRTIVSIPAFFFASGFQHDCHHYLFSLKKYSLPAHPLFNKIICPHYAAECVIYLSLAVFAAPRGDMVNKTMVSCLAFVAVNLGITAAGSKEWYRENFGDSAVQGKWRMIPYVY